MTDVNILKMCDEVEELRSVRTRLVDERTRLLREANNLDVGEAHRYRAMLLEVNEMAEQINSLSDDIEGLTSHLKQIKEEYNGG